MFQILSHSNLGYLSNIYYIFLKYLGSFLVLHMSFCGGKYFQMPDK